MNRIEGQHLKTYFEKYCLELYQKKRSNNHQVTNEPPIVHINEFVQAPPPVLVENELDFDDEYDETEKKVIKTTSIFHPSNAGTSSKLVKETNHMLNVSMRCDVVINCMSSYKRVFWENDRPLWKN